MATDRLTEISSELQAVRGDEILAAGSVREALAVDQWEAAHRAVDQLRAARERREDLEAEVDELLTRT